MQRRYTYEYEKLKPGERQYDGINLAINKIVDARYIDSVVYNGNPYIEALPFARTSAEVRKEFNLIPSLPSSKTFYSLTEQVQEMVISKIKDYRIALPFHVDIEKEFSRTLIESYSMREQNDNGSELSVGGVSYNVSHGLSAYHSGEATNGFAMLGVAGSGKSTAMNMVLDHYPQVIIHNLNGETFIQIVYLYVTCEPNSNFNALYSTIGKAIDNALGNDNQIYEREINKIRGGLAAKAAKIRDLVEKLSIGVIVFDEIQNIDLKSTKENSLEAFLTLNNTTHVGLGVLGTEEAFRDLFSKDRTIRRFSSYIAASRYCKSETTFINIIRGLFLAQVFEEYIEPDHEIISAFYQESGGVVAYAVMLYYCLIRDYISKKKKPAITKEYIIKISKTSQKIIHDNILKKSRSTLKDSFYRNRLIEEMNSYGETEDDIKQARNFDNSISHSSMFLKANVINTLIKKHSEYNSVSIENAVDTVVNNGVETEAEALLNALELLKKGKTDLRPARKKKSPYIEIDHNKIIQDLLSAAGEQI